MARYGTLNIADELYRIWWKKSLLIGIPAVGYSVGFIYFKDWFYSNLWAPITALLAGIAILSFFNGIWYLWYGVVAPFPKYFPKTFYVSAFVCLWYAALAVYRIASEIGWMANLWRYSPYPEMFDLRFVFIVLLVVEIAILYKVIILIKNKRKN